jgi:hypothetical protein
MVQEPVTASRFRNHKVFYFTNNMVTYDMACKGTSHYVRIWSLVRELKWLELLYQCQLEVIQHIPGDVMIDEGTGGLSRGVWNTALEVAIMFPVADLFAPSPLNPGLIQWGYAQVGVAQPSHLRCFQDLDAWPKEDMIKQDCVWSVSPTVARQAFTAAALTWAESPLDSSHLLLLHAATSHAT